MHDPDQGGKCGSVCRCCAALAAAREQALFDPHPHWRSPLTPGVQTVNLSHSEDGRDVWAALDGDWPRMFSQLFCVGPVQVLTFNAGAILSRRLDRVSFDSTSDGAKCVGCRGTLRLDFRHFGSARAVHCRRSSGHGFGVEFADRTGEIVHALMLTHTSDFDAFFAWVRLHQACAVIPRSSPGRRDASSRCRNQTYLWEAFRQEEGLALLTASIRQAAALRVTVFGAAASQTLDLVPAWLTKNQEWTTVSDGIDSLHFSHKQLALFKDAPQRPSDGTNYPVLGLADEDGSPLLLLCPLPSVPAGMQTTS